MTLSYRVLCMWEILYGRVLWSAVQDCKLLYSAETCYRLLRSLLSPLSLLSLLSMSTELAGPAEPSELAEPAEPAEPAETC